MSASIRNSSSGIHEYRGQIAHAIDELQLQLTKTERAIETAAESWKDGNFTEFQQNFSEDKEKIQPLCNVLDRYQREILYQLEQKLRLLEDTIFIC